jgi:hypothetical protein
MKTILREHDVRHVHVTLELDNKLLFFDKKKDVLIDLYFDRLSVDLFNKEHDRRFYYRDYCSK